MPNLKKVPFQIAIAFDQLANACAGGWADETLSARAWRLRARKGWGKARRVIDKIFFWQPQHCRAAYESEQTRQHLPPELRFADETIIKETYSRR